MRNTVKIYTFWLVTAVFLSVHVFLTIENSTSGSEIAKLESESEALIERNRELSETEVGGSSLTTLSNSAHELGFDKPETVIYLGRETQFAKLP